MSEPKNRLPDRDDPATEEEAKAAERLRHSLEGGRRSAGEHADLIEALRAASAPEPLSERRHEAILSRALSGPAPAASNVTDLAERRGFARGGASGKVVYGAFGAVAALVAAAAAMLVVVRGDENPASVASSTPSPLVRSRSTSQLFSQQFPVTGGTTDRIDRIAYARQQDLRENRFTAWGIR